MSMEVRVEVFNALGKIEMVSEDILLQTLSKRVLGITKKMTSRGQFPAEQFEILASSMAGVLVHGLEDEFYEVTFVARHSLSFYYVEHSSIWIRSTFSYTFSVIICWCLC